MDPDTLGRDPSTIYREIKRNSVRFDDQLKLNGYHAIATQNRSEQLRAIHRKPNIYPKPMAAMRSGFDDGWSPEQIADRPQPSSPKRVTRARKSSSGKSCRGFWTDIAARVQEWATHSWSIFIENRCDQAAKSRTTRPAFTGSRAPFNIESCPLTKTCAMPDA